MLLSLYKLGIFLALTLPLKVAYALADFCGSIYYALAKKDRKIVCDNLKVILNHTNNGDNISRLARRVFTNFARYLVEFFRLPKLDLKYLQNNIKVEGLDNLNKALASGKGALIISAHLGNWELGAPVLSMLGYKISVIAWSHKNSSINSFFLRQRKSKGVQVIPLGTAISGSCRALRNNCSVALAGDVDYAQPERGISVKFFGRNSVMPKGPALLSLKTGAPIVPAFFLREKMNAFNFAIGEPIVCAPSGNWQHDVTRLTQAFAKVIESHVARNPAQWFMLTPKWKKE